MQLGAVKRAMVSGQMVTMNGGDAFAGIRYRVRGVIMRMRQNADAAGGYEWVYYAELADRSGCITVAPLERVIEVEEGA